MANSDAKDLEIGNSRTHNNLICNIRSNFTHSMEKNISFIYNALHHPNELVRLLLHVKLLRCIMSNNRLCLYICTYFDHLALVYTMNVFVHVNK